jgi:hypothetical protein
MLLFGRTNTLHQLLHGTQKTENYLLVHPGTSEFTFIVISTDRAGVAPFLARSIPLLPPEHKQQ